MELLAQEFASLVNCLSDLVQTFRFDLMDLAEQAIASYQ